MSRYVALLTFAFGLLALSANADDACDATQIQVKSTVTVDDGDTYQTESFFHSAQHHAFRIRDQLILAEGPYVWVKDGNADWEAGTEFHKVFSLGHQFTGLYRHFESITDYSAQSEIVLFAGEEHTALVGTLPYGGRLALVGERYKPLGLIMFLDGAEPIEITIADWHPARGIPNPHIVSVNDGQRVFTYDFDAYGIGDVSNDWIAEEISKPSNDELELYRLHRKSLQAHCLGYADMLADIADKDVTMISNGEIFRTTKDEIAERFREVFRQVDYQAYRDLKPPQISISEDGSMGWAHVEIETVTRSRDGGDESTSQWAWTLFARKTEDGWKMVGNNSSRRP